MKTLLFFLVSVSAYGGDGIFSPQFPRPSELPTGGVPNKQYGDALPAEPFDDDNHPGDYALSFHDEFNGSRLNSKTWINSYAWNDRNFPDNGELECYLEQNVNLKDGHVIFTAKAEPVHCPKIDSPLPYTSGMINSQNSFAQRYGYFVMRAKLPAGKGLWPAFWLLPMRSWPPEIDIMEVLDHDLTHAYTTFHWSDAKGVHRSASRKVTVPDLSADFHDYAVLWEEGSLQWFIDGKKFFEHRSEAIPNEPMYILANLAVGGKWPGNPDTTTKLPADMQIDFIRVYKKQN